MSNSNDVLMATLADNGNGSYAYMDNIDEAQKLFAEDLTSTLQVIALDAKIQVYCNPDVVAYYNLTTGSGLIGYENRAVCRRLWQCHSLDFRNDAGDAGRRIATVQLRWEDPDTHQGTEIAPMPK